MITQANKKPQFINKAKCLVIHCFYCTIMSILAIYNDQQYLETKYCIYNG